MKANDFVKLVFGYFADNPEAGLDFIEHIENRAELAASVQNDNVWDKRNVVKADIIQHCGSDELPIARIVDDKPRNPTEWSKGSVMEEFAKSHPAVDAEQPKKKKSGKQCRVRPDGKLELSPQQQKIYDYIIEHPELSYYKIGQILGIESSHIFTVIHNIKRKGWNLPECASKKQDVDKTKSKPDSLDERMENAYMGEHVNIEPEQPEKKPLSPKEHDFYNYILAHPDAKMPRVCADLHLSMAMYYYLKGQIKKKGYNIQGAVDFNVVEEKPEPGIL